MANNIVSLRAGRGRRQHDEEAPFIQEPFQGLIDEAFRLARRVERIGGPSQGERLARMAEFLKANDLAGAMKERDAIRGELQIVRWIWFGAFVVLACLGLAYFVHIGFLLGPILALAAATNN